MSYTPIDLNKLGNDIKKQYSKFTEQLSIECHKERINSVKFSKDSVFLATASEDNNINLLEVESKNIKQQVLGHTDSVRTISFHPHTPLLSSGSLDNQIKIWDLQTGHEAWKQQHSGSIYASAFSPCGNYIAQAGGLNNQKIYVHAISQFGQFGTYIRELSNHYDSVNDMSWTHTGNMLVTASADYNSNLWDIATCQKIREFKGHTQAVYSATCWSSPFGQDQQCMLIATSSGDSTVKLWDPRIEDVVKTLEGHQADCQCVKWSPFGNNLVSSGGDQRVLVWDIVADKKEFLYEHDREVRTVDWSSNGQFIATGDESGIVKIWNVNQ